MRTIPFASSFAALAALLAAQNPCEGNGFGGAYITTTPAIAGGSLVMNIGSPATPNGIGLLAFGIGAGPTIPFCHDISAFIGNLAVLDGSGNAQFTFAPIPASAFGATLYARSVTIENNNFSLSKVVRVEVEFANSSRPVPPLAAARSLHTATSFSSGPRDNRTGAIIAGGATGSMIFPVAQATTEVFDPLSRTWSAGPAMTVPRASHAAVRLLDGRILIAGGMVNAGAPAIGGPATSICEIYSPATNTLAPTGSMLQARMGHAMTVLADGRVLASGGFADWTNANSGPGFVALLNTAQFTSELFDPATGTWSAGPTMASRRSGHTQTLLGDGRVLITGGVNGGTSMMVSVGTSMYVPTFTASCELFVPATNTFVPAAAVPLARGFHGASTLANGRVLVTGGAASVGANGEGAATNTCAAFDAATNSWSTAAPLPTPVAFHTQTATAAGSAVLTGGYTGNFASLIASDATVLHTGPNAAALTPLGIHPAVPAPAFVTGAHAAVLMHDGTTLITGGYAGFPGVEFHTAVLHIAP